MSSTAFQDSAQATATAAGVFSVTFQSVRLGYIWTGSVQVPSAVSNSVIPIKFTAFDAGIPIGSWYNDQSSPNVQVQQQLSIAATGLVAGAYRAFFKGMITPAAETPPFWPGPTPAPPPAGPFTLFSGTGPITIAAGGQLTLCTNAPVTLGTSVEMSTIANNGPGACRLTLTWSFGSGIGVSETFDIKSGNTLQGLVVPNLSSALSATITASNTNAATLDVGSAGMALVTGLPPIVREPLAPQNVLMAATGTLPANGNATLPFLVPYAGPAMLSGTFTNPGGTVGTHPVLVDLNGSDYLANALSWGHAITDQVSDNTGAQVAVLQPRVILIPSLINTVLLTSQNPNNLTYSVSIAGIGP